jgi:hypothetical protein
MKDDFKYYGKYRGTVINNIDPEGRGRIQAIVPDVQGATPLTYALPCMPLASIKAGIHLVPIVGSAVWIEFEQGDPDYPIWTGCFWGQASELPSDASSGLPVSPSIILQTQGQHKLVISDVPGIGGIEIKSTTGASIKVNDIGITIDNGKGATIELIGPSVDINKGAMKII